MSETLLLGLVLQAASVVVLILVFRRGVLHRIGSYFVFGAFIYHGLTEIIQALTGLESKYRGFSHTNDIDTWTVVVGCAMLTFAVAYILVTTAKDRDPTLGNPLGPTDLDIDRIKRTLDWRILTLASLPLIAAIAAGNLATGHQSGSMTVESSTTIGLAQQFLTLLLVMATISYVLAHRGRVVLPLLVQLAVMSLVGSRLDVFVAAATTLFGLAILQRAPSVRQVFAVLAVVATMALAITGARNDVGRSQFAAAGFPERVQFLVTGALSTIQGVEPSYAGQTQPLGERLDGNSFPAAVLAALESGREPVGLTTAVNSLSLAVPSFLNPQKLTTALELRSEKIYLNAHLGIGIPGDFLPTQFGSILGWFGPLGLMVLAGLMGLAIGVAERSLRRKLTPSRLILTLTLFVCVMSYPAAMEQWPIEFRGALVAVAVVFLVEHFRDYRRGDVAARGSRSPWRSRTIGATTDPAGVPMSGKPNQLADCVGPATWSPRR